MSDKPDFVDNRNGNTLSAALQRILQANADNAHMVVEPQVDEARIATAFFSPEGFKHIAAAIAPIPSIKLLLGADPITDAFRWQRNLDETEQRFVARKLRENLKKQENKLRSERDHIPFSRPSSLAVKKLVEALRAGNMSVRRYEKNFLHAKAYIFTSEQEVSNGGREAIIAGSSNLTAAGLTSNLELNLGRYDTATIAKSKEWFDQLWNEAEPFDLAAFFEEMFEPKTPFEIFIRVLWELYGNDIDIEIESGLPLTSFQKHGVVRAQRLINETGGVIVADEVGLGKTFIAGEILNGYVARRQQALLICPAALRDTTWREFTSNFQLYTETLSFEELARDEQLWDEKRRPFATSRHLKRRIDQYQLVIIDEAHNYRNPDSPSRADVLRALLHGKRKDVLMLTATPVNNSLWDLYHLLRFFIKQDSFLASKGILSIRERFSKAMRTNPSNLLPDLLYPIVDATTVKRTRRFIKKYYSNDRVKINGKWQEIVFPDPKAISVRYELDSLMPKLFDLVETYFDPENEKGCIKFARYKTSTYLKNNSDDDYESQANGASGLLLSGLLKRFESSTEAFRNSIKRLIDQNKKFLEMLETGYVASTKFLDETDSVDDDDFQELIESSVETHDANYYQKELLRDHVQKDIAKLSEIWNRLNQIKAENDPKLKALIQQLEIIALEAESEGKSREDKIDKRKVIIFSYFADTVRWINSHLEKEIPNNPKLAAYKERFAIVVGSGDGEGRSKAFAAERFAPKTAGKPGSPDELDILISTDVLAEGMNLQQARHIINYDMPWNPMRLVQRHGRIDRIGSQHPCVFLRTIFPVDRLNDLLKLEERITRKIALAAASVGVVSPIEGADSSNRDFTESKEELQKLLDEDASFYERGGTEAGTDSGEEYRQTLRKAIESCRDDIVQMPWKAGSGMRKGDERGIFFCAKVGERTYLRFVHANENWKPRLIEVEAENSSEQGLVPLIERELGRCLRLIKCEEETTLVLDEATENAAYELWEVAREDIYRDWMRETDPANLHPPIRKLNREIADFIRKNTPVDIKQEDIERALDIVESPWSMRDENRLRQLWKSTEESGSKKSEYMIGQILNTGLEPFRAPAPLPEIEQNDIELLVWMAITV